MAWETRKGRGRYYTRSVRVGGRVRREYLGSGEAAELIAALDTHERAEREAERQERQQEAEEAAAAAAPLNAFCELTELLARAALLSAGYHRHQRGEWRKRREQETDTEGTPHRG